MKGTWPLCFALSWHKKINRYASILWFGKLFMCDSIKSVKWSVFRSLWSSASTHQGFFVALGGLARRCRVLAQVLLDVFVLRRVVIGSARECVYLVRQAHWFFNLVIVTVVLAPCIPSWGDHFDFVVWAYVAWMWTFWWWAAVRLYFSLFRLLLLFSWLCAEALYD